MATLPFIKVPEGKSAHINLNYSSACPIWRKLTALYAVKAVRATGIEFVRPKQNCLNRFYRLDRKLNGAFLSAALDFLSSNVFLFVRSFLCLLKAYLNTSTKP